MEPKVLKDANGEVVLSGIHTYGETVHIFVERNNYNGVFMPGYKKWESKFNTESTAISICRSLCRKRWLKPDESMGKVL